MGKIVFEKKYLKKFKKEIVNKKYLEEFKTNYASKKDHVLLQCLCCAKSLNGYWKQNQATRMPSYQCFF